MNPQSDPTSSASRARRGGLMLLVSLPIVGFCVWAILSRGAGDFAENTVTVVRPAAPPKLSHAEAMSKAIATLKPMNLPTAIPAPVQLAPATFAPPPIAVAPPQASLSVAPLPIAALPFAGQPSTPSNAALGATDLDRAFHPSRAFVALPDLISTTSTKATSNNASAKSVQDAISENARLEQARKFVMSLCQDQRGCLWVGCEADDKPGTGGVQRFDPSAPPLHQWTQFTTKDGIGDDSCYAIACDRLGRIWAGSLRHGVSVFNGKTWATYEVVGGLSRADTLSGPLGEHVFAVKVCEKTGDVWISTNCGIAVYSESHDDWKYLTRADGLPSDQSNAIAFDMDGNAYIGTQCDGITMANAADDYKTWRTVTGPDQAPLVPAGSGLPTNLINDVLVANDGTVYAATDAGLAWSKDHGSSWQFVRGADWADKVRGLAEGPPNGWRPTAGAVLAEDYATSLGQDARGYLWVGSRRKGAECFEPRTMQTVQSPSSDQYITSVLSIDSAPILGTYGDGLSGFHASRPSSANTACVLLPSGARPPTVAELNRDLEQMASVPRLSSSSDHPFVTSLDDDWLTEGDYLGRIGRYWCVLAAMDDPSGYFWGAAPDHVPFAVSLGSPCRPTDYYRFWIYRFYTTERRSLEIPPIYMHSRVVHGLTTWGVYRRQAEWDDHGETYKMSDSGPGLVFNMDVPAGVFVLSMYLVNDNGQVNKNRWRDFKIDVSTAIGGTGAKPLPQATTHISAQGRVVNFWNGVYKRFAVEGPAHLLIHLDRNYSFNVQLCALMLDVPAERMIGYDMSAEQWHAEQAMQALSDAKLFEDWTSAPARKSQCFAPRITLSDAARTLIDRMSVLQRWNPRWWAEHSTSIARQLARVTPAMTAPRTDYSVTHQGACFQAGLYEAWEQSRKDNGQTADREVEKSLRWDLVSRDNSGRGYPAIRDYLISHVSAARRIDVDLPMSETAPPAWTAH